MPGVFDSSLIPVLQEVVAFTEARHGMFLFYRQLGCSDCHSGVFQTDQDFHAIAMPQVGPGKGDNLPGYNDGRDDFGRERVTGDPADRFKFRTPTLRNVELTGPYGHAGAYYSLDDMVRHHLNAVSALNNYDHDQLMMPSRPDLDAQDFVVMDDENRRGAIAAANELEPRRLKHGDMQALMSFLAALTDPATHDLRSDIPQRVPSGLTLAE